MQTETNPVFPLPLKGGACALTVPASGGVDTESFESWIQRQLRDCRVHMDGDVYRPELLGVVDRYVELCTVERHLAEYAAFSALSEGCCKCTEPLTCDGACTAKF